MPCPAAQVRELAVDALPGIAKVRELAGIDDFLAVMNPRPGSAAPARADPVARTPAPPAGNLGVKPLRVGVQALRER
jgi:hypothetical protein